MQQIKDMAAERTHMERELNELKAAAQVIVDMINPPEEGDAQEKTGGATARCSSKHHEVCVSCARVAGQTDSP